MDKIEITAAKDFIIYNELWKITSEGSQKQRV